MSDTENIDSQVTETAGTSRDLQELGAEATQLSPAPNRLVSTMEMGVTVRVESSGDPGDPSAGSDCGAHNGAVLEDASDSSTSSKQHASDAALAATDELCGRTLQHFRVMERIGVGGMGAVYRAQDVSLDRTVALKVIRSEEVGVGAQRERFLREARAQARLSHPNVVPIFYVGEEEGVLFFAMELVDGEPLDAVLARGERVEWPRALELLYDVADGLRMAQERQIVHRDIKPSNLLVDRSGLVKVADFGLAKNVATDGSADHQLTQQGAVLGSPLYMSPEQAQGEPVDHRSDIYSLGATFFHLLTGRPPFQSSSAVGVIAKHLSAPVPSLCKELPGLPVGVSRLVERMLAKDPADRFPDYESLQHAVRGALPSSTIPAGFFVRGMALVADLLPMLAVIVMFDFLGVLIASLYLVIGWWRFGKTFGKWLFRLRVRTLENEPLSLRRSILRSAAWGWAWIVFGLILLANRAIFGVWGVGGGGPVYAKAPWLALSFSILTGINFTLYAVGLLWAGIKGHKHAWHDLVSGTMVVYDMSPMGTSASEREIPSGPEMLTRSSSEEG